MGKWTAFVKLLLLAKENIVLAMLLSPSLKDLVLHSETFYEEPTNQPLL